MPVPSPRKLAALAAVAALVAAASITAAPSASAAPDAPQWGDCPDQVAASLQCATVEVPVDYDEPNGPTMEIEISRLASDNPDERRGVLLLNPGGPGGPGLDMPAMMAQMGIPASVLDAYDLIGFDPRGIGHSSPATCNLTGQQQAQTFPPYAESAADVDEYAVVAEKIVDQCQDADDGTLRHLSTENTARDMDVIREALGEPKISYLGYSYGTYLGAVYAQLFGEHTDRIVLDSAIGPEWVWRTEFRSWGKATELRFPDFAKWAAARDASYELGSTPRAVRRNFLHLADRLAEKPVDGIDGSTFRLTMRSAMYSDANFPTFAQFWQDIARGDGAAAMDRARQAKLLAPDSSTVTGLAVLCNDASWPRSVGTYKRAVAKDRKRFPLVGAFAANLFPCAFWPPPLDETVQITDDGPANILIPQNTRDPATIHAGARQLRRALGDRARLVTVDTGGHGAYLIDGNACVDNRTTKFLLGGKLPATDRYCPAESTRTAVQDSARVDAIRELHSRQRIG